MTLAFEDCYCPEPNSGCWLWTAGGDRTHGYGAFSTGGPGKSEWAHRHSYRIHKGEIPSGMHVLHNCDTPACVNPDHLRLGTQRDNNRDRDERGRTALGTANGKSKITPEMVSLIRQSPMSERPLAKVLGIHRGTVNAVRSGRTWSHV